VTKKRPPLSSEPPPDASAIDIESGVGAMSRLGYVHLRWGERSGQLTTREARRHAYAILDAAAAADHDAAVLRWLTETMGLDIAPASQVLVDLRVARQAVDAESGND
jgi:hypothetical protein